jgi:hypothetical protein
MANTTILLNGSSSSQPYTRQHDIYDDIDREKLNELDDDIVLGLPWQSQEFLDIQDLLWCRSRSKVKFFVAAVIVLFLWLLSLPAMIYAVNTMENSDRAIQICAVLGSLDALSFIAIVGIGYYFKYLDFEIQIRVAAKMKEEGISDPTRYVAMGGDANRHTVI